MAYEVSMQEESLRRGPWLEEEDERLKDCVNLLGERRWDSLAKQSGLRRSGKSCRLRWLNYLHPNLKHGEINAEEELVIIQLHKQWGNKWAKIARRLPGRTDNEIKNYWRSHLRKKLAQTQQQEALASEINNIKQDERTPISDSVTQTSSNNSGGYPYEEKDVDMSQSSIDLSYANYELSNNLFGSSPYEARVSDWMSYEQCEGKLYQTHSGEESWNHFSSFNYPSWSYDEEICTSIVWDSPSSIWAMD